MPPANRRGHNFRKDPAKVKKHAHTIKLTDEEDKRLSDAYKAAKLTRMEYMRRALLEKLAVDAPVVHSTPALEKVILVEKLRAEGVATGDIAKKTGLSLKKVLEILGMS